MKHLPVAILIAVLLAALVLGKYEIAIIALMALLMRYEIGENANLRAHIYKMRTRIEWLMSELGQTQDAAAQDTERWR